MSRERRRHYRLRFPAPVRPVLWIDSKSYVVTELSEGGLRALKAQSLRNFVSGDLVFSDGLVREVTGQVLRPGIETVIYRLKGVSFSDVMREQRRLLREFPLLG